MFGPKYMIYGLSSLFKQIPMKSMLVKCDQIVMLTLCRYHSIVFSIKLQIHSIEHVVKELELRTRTTNFHSTVKKKNENNDASQNQIAIWIVKGKI